MAYFTQYEGLYRICEILLTMRTIRRESSLDGLGWLKPDAGKSASLTQLLAGLYRADAATQFAAQALFPKSVSYKK